MYHLLTKAAKENVDWWHDDINQLPCAFRKTVSLNFRGALESMPSLVKMNAGGLRESRSTLRHQASTFRSAHNAIGIIDNIQ
jgi:hypothetical protein